MNKIFVLSVIAFILSGCSANLARFSVASTGNIPISNSSKGEYVEGKDCTFNLFGFPIGNTQNRISGAVAKALEEAHKKGQPADALTNVDVSSNYVGIWIVGRDCVTAKGQAIGIK